MAGFFFFFFFCESAAGLQVRIVKEEGPVGLFRGAGPTVVRAMALNMGMLASNDQVKPLGLTSKAMFEISKLCALCRGLLLASVVNVRLSILLCLRRAASLKPVCSVGRVLTQSCALRTVCVGPTVFSVRVLAVYPISP